jgi:DNA-binding IclR family transcriptional regulator
MVIESSPFGSRARTKVLLALRLLAESYARELARVLSMPLSGVQRALASLERDGLVAGRSFGRTRMYRFDPRYFAHQELQRSPVRFSHPS